MLGSRFGFTLLVFSAVSLMFPSLATGQSATPSAVNGSWIAYQASEILLVRENGSEDHPLIPDWTGGYQYHPDWSPDGQQIAFSSDDTDDTRDIWVADIDGSDSRLVFDCAAPCVWSDDPAFSPDGSKLLFETADSPDGLSYCAIQAMDLSTYELTAVWESAILTDCAYVPRWSPDATRIVFEIDRFIDESIDATTVVGSAIAVITMSDPPDQLPTMLTELSSFATYPDWNPVTGEIVFAMAGEGGQYGPYDLFTIQPDGTNLTRRTEYGGTGFQAIQPTWLPGGLGIIFVYDQMWTNATMATIDVATNEVVISEISATHPRKQP